MNLLDARRRARRRRDRRHAGPAVLPRQAAGRVLGLRPEDVAFARRGRGPPSRGVTAVEYLGADALVSCRIAGARRACRPRCRRRVALAVGGDRRLAWAPRRAARLRRRRAAYGRRLRSPTATEPAALGNRRLARQEDIPMKRLPACARRRAGDHASARRPPAATEITFYYPSPSAVRSPRSSTAMPPSSTKAQPGHHGRSRSIPAATRTRSSRRSPPRKRGNAPDVAVLLSTDMFTLIDDDMIVPYRRDRQDAPSDKDWLKSFYPAFMAQQPGRRPDLGHSVPALDHRAVLEQGRLQGGRPRSRPGAGDLGRTWSPTARS